jgi:hypothetical protein
VLRLLIGIPSFNHARTIPHVARAATDGVAKHFPGVEALLYNADGGSHDGTPSAFLGIPRANQVHLESEPYRGPSGKGSAVRAIFERAVAVQAEACCIVDADLRSITPEWIAGLAGPVLAGTYDYITPYYQRHKFDGTITNNVTYPLVRALFGQRIRQPIGGDFGFTGWLAAAWLRERHWSNDVARFGIDIFMTCTALARQARVAQATLGSKVHDPKDPAADLGPMFRQVVGTLFALAEPLIDSWWHAGGSRPVPVLGSPASHAVEELTINRAALLGKFSAGWTAGRGVAAAHLPAAAVAEIETSLDTGLDAATWVTVLLASVAAFQKAAADRDPLLDLLAACYYGRVARFAREAGDATPEEAEALIESQAELTERRKPELLRAWPRDRARRQMQRPF